MRICGIVLNYFGFIDTVQCVESLMADDSLEQIVIVDNSANLQEQTKIESRFSGRERIHIVCLKRNLGFAGGVNYALSSLGIAAYDAFLILNNDTLIPSGTLRLLEKRLLTGGFGFVAPAIYDYPETSSVWSKGNYYNRFTGLITDRPLAMFPGNFQYLTGCCLLIRTHVFETLGWFDESFFMYGEDVEFCHRAARQGLKYGLVPEAKIFHKGSSSSGNNSLFYEYHINRSHLLLCGKLARTPKHARCCRVLKLTVMTLRAIWRVLRYGSLNSLRGLLRSVSESPL